MRLPTPARLHVGTLIRPTEKPKVRWIAPTSDGTAHAYPPGWLSTALCGALPVDERWAYGVKVHHERCVILLGEDG